MIYPWKLNYWQSGEWQVVNERLKDMEKRHVGYNPGRSNLFLPLRSLAVPDVRVAIIGQDPYPQGRFATGRAFSIPGDIPLLQYPPTLQTIFREYSTDLGYPIPNKGILDRWEAQGVLLWNAIPTCKSGESLSHDWPEYQYLTREIVRTLSQRGIVFALLGAVARRSFDDIDLSKNEVILTSHPSPRGSRFSKTPFEGSRLFSTINDKLNGLGLEPINWRLDDQYSPNEGPGNQALGGPDPLRQGKRVLENTTGSSCGPLYDSRGIRIRE